ncbi:hypothetical protein ACMFWY_11155 [Roseiconus sp. JC912]|uniref:hypothetical protein n=1 Tax=Roseiconus sp. JC912 TaxID=3396307 RepID=UPI003A4C6414
MPVLKRASLIGRLRWQSLRCQAFIVGFGIFGGLVAAEAHGQMIQSTTPMTRFGTGFNESFGLNWSLRGPNFFAQSPGLATSPFGNPDPNAGLRTGASFSSGGLRGSIGLSLSQGSSSQISSTVPSITTMNGYPGSIQSQTLRPFVTGINPVVAGGGYGQPVHDNVAAQAASIYQNAQNQYLQSRVAANLQSKQRSAEEALRRGIEAEESGNLRKARANYRKALASDQGPLRMQIMARLQRFQSR